MTGVTRYQLEGGNTWIVCVTLGLLMGSEGYQHHDISLPYYSYWPTSKLHYYYSYYITITIDRDYRLTRQEARFCFLRIRLLISGESIINNNLMLRKTSYIVLID